MFFFVPPPPPSFGGVFACGLVFFGVFFLWWNMVEAHHEVPRKLFFLHSLASLVTPTSCCRVLFFFILLFLVLPSCARGLGFFLTFWDVGFVCDVGCTHHGLYMCSVGTGLFVFHSSHYVSSMSHIWLKQDIEGVPWSPHVSVLAATRYLGERGVKLFDTQVNQEAKRNGSRHGWHFCTHPNTVVARSATPSGTPGAASSIPSGLAGVSRVCGACDSKFGGHHKKCVSYGKQTHELCGPYVQHKFHCYVCVCLV